MKKISLLLGAIVMTLSSCGSNPQSVSSSSESSKDSFSSAEISSSPSSSAGEGSSSDLAVAPVVSYVAKKAAKYNNCLSASFIMSKSGLSESSPTTEGNFIRALKAAFDGVMPALTGQRRYGGYFTLPDGSTGLTQKTLSALEWLVSYGLWGEGVFEENAVIDEAFMGKVIQRFYTYFGTEENDDFFAYNNHDFLYESDDDVNVKPEDDYRRMMILDSETVKTNVISYAKSLIESGNSNASLYQQALAYYEGTLDYSFLDDSSVKEQLQSITSISSLSDWLTCERTCFADFGQSSLAYLEAPEFSYDDNYNVVSTLYTDPTVVDFGLTDDSYSSDNVITAVTLAYKSIGYSDDESSTYATNLSNFGNRYWTIFQSDEYDGKAGSIDKLYDSASKQDLFAANDIGIDISAFYTEAGYSLVDLAGLYTSDAQNFLSFGKALLNASKEELQALALYDFVSANNAAIAYTKGTAGDYNSFLDMIQNNLAADFMDSAYYSDSLKVLTDLFTGIKRVFSKRLKTSNWLSADGLTAVQKKLDAVKSTLIGTSSDGMVFDYRSISTPTGLGLSNTFGKSNAVFQLGLTHLIVGGLKFDKSLLLMRGPFLSNAFYTPATNYINITFGAIFSVGLDLAKYSYETILAKIGFVLGHEITHGFDSGGVYFDENGHYVKESFIPKDDKDKFTALALKVEGIYQDQEVLPGLAQDPNITIGEDLADGGGLAFMEELGKEKETFDFKLFYREYVKSMGAKVTRSRFVDKHLKDVHPFGRVRCNVLLANSPLFQSTFAFSSDDAMYRSVAEQVTVW